MIRQFYSNPAQTRYALSFFFIVAFYLTFHATYAVAASKIVPFGKYGAWRINSVFSANGAFSNCFAKARYKSGIEVSVIFERQGRWLLRFYKHSWPNRQLSKFPSTIRIDGRRVFKGNGFFKGRSAYIILGRELKRVTALMRGQRMSVSTSSGTTSFRLDGTYRATLAVARCFDVNRGRYRNNDAFSGNTRPYTNRNSTARQGAFGGSTASSNNTSRGTILSRGSTLDLATSYLSVIKTPYKFLPKNKNVFPRFPVNWQFSNGRYGGVRAYRNARMSSSQELRRLVALNAANCNGRSATEKEKPLRLKNGEPLLRAKVVCETSRGVTTLRYSVARLASNVLMVVVNGGLTRSPASRSPKASTESNRQIQRQPAPNEL